MKITVEPSPITTELDGARVRFWNGTTATGARLSLAVVAVITDDIALQTWMEKHLTIRLAPLERETEIVALVEIGRWVEGGGEGGDG